MLDLRKIPGVTAPDLLNPNIFQNLAIRRDSLVALITIRSFFPFVVAVFAAVFAPPLLMAVPIEIARESFEGTGIGFTTSVPQFDEPTVPTSDFFSVQPNNGTKLSGGTITGGDLANMFAAEDIDTTRVREWGRRSSSPPMG